MYNFIGSVPPAGRSAREPGRQAARYGKGPRPGRKVGHVTLRTESAEELGEKLPEWDKQFVRSECEPET